MTTRDKAVPVTPRRVGVRELAQGKWLSLEEIQYVGRDGSTRTWEAASRRARCGAVVVITRLMPSGRYLLIEQYRPPVDAMVLEFPAGLVDAGEDPRQTAVREVREETGYTGTVTWFSGDCLSSPGMSGETVAMAVLEIDETAPENRNPAPDWDEGEHIDPYPVALPDVPEFLRQRLRAGVVVDSKVTSYFLGIGCRW